MYRIAVLACLVAAACGRLGFDPEAQALFGDSAVHADSSGDPSSGPDGSAAGSACTAFGAWGTPKLVPVVNSTDVDWGPMMSIDELELVFASARSGGNFQLYDARRATRSDDWSTPTLISEIPAQANDPTLSANRLELYWGGGGVMHASRATLGDPWTGQTLEIGDTAGFSNAGGPDVSNDGLTLLYTATETSTGKYRELVTHRANTTVAFTAGALDTSLVTAHAEGYGALRGDGLEIMYAGQAMGSGTSDLFAATRPTTADDTFGSAALVTELSSTFDDGDPQISDAGYTVIFASDRAGGVGSYDLYFATRTCP